MSMTMRIIHTGYTKYLEDSVSDSMRNLSRGLGVSSYYTHEGNPPGRWMGHGLNMIGKQEGDYVGKTELFTFIERMQDPETGHKLAPHIIMRAKDPRNPHSNATVLGYDATFSAPKSFSILWMLSNENERALLDDIWNQALDETLTQFETDAAYGRMGHGGVTRVKLEGFSVAAYQHYTNRDGEPHYHTHAVISNLARRDDGTIVALDGRTMLAVKEHMSVLHAQRLRDLLHQNLGAEWELRDGLNASITGAKVWEMKAIPDELIKTSSERTVTVNAKTNTLVEKFTHTHGRQPTNKELKQLHRQAWSATRKTKTEDTISIDEAKKRLVTSLDTLGLDAREVVASVQTDNTSTLTYNSIDQDHILDLIKPAVHATLVDETSRQTSSTLTDQDTREAFEHHTAANRTTFSLAHILATSQTMIDGLHMDSLADSVHVAQDVTQQTIQQFTPITENRYRIPEELINDPRYTTTDELGRLYSTLDLKRGTPLYASNSLMAAEKNLLNNIDLEHEQPFITRTTVTKLLDKYNEQAAHPLSDDQYQAAVRALTTHRQIFSIIGAAGTGKTTTLKAMKYVIDHAHGAGHIVGTAPSTRAAQEMQTSMNMSCANIAAILTEHKYHALENNIERLHTLIEDPHTTSAEKKAARTQLIRDMATLKQYTIPDNSILIVDEAGMAATTDLALISQLAAEHNTRVLFTGDHMQLGAVGEGSGALYETYLQGKSHYAELATLFRFHDQHEAEVTRHLREGITKKDGTYTAISEYRAMNRIHASSDEEVMLTQAYQDTLADLAGGQDVILMASDNKTVSIMNEQFTHDLMLQGKVETDYTKRLTFADGVAYGKGDHIITRHNTSRNITTSTGERVTNGDHWTIDHIDFIRKQVHVSNPQEHETAELPFWYVEKYAQGGYVSTIHLAQGSTYDKARLIIDEDSLMNRASLYVAQTRGKQSNDIYMQLNPLNDADKAQWVAAKRTDYEKQGKKHYAWNTTNPDPQKYYTDTDLLPTDDERADAILNKICASTPTVLATRSRDQYNKQTHSISTLLSERRYLQSLIVQHDMTTHMKNTYSEHDIATITQDYQFAQLIDAYEKAYVINPDQANQIITERTHGSTPVHASTTDTHLFTPAEQGDSVSVMIRKLNTISAPYHGTRVLTPNGYATRYTPQFITEKTAAQLDMLHQADRMLDMALEERINQAFTHPLPWQRLLAKDERTQIRAMKQHTHYRELMRSILIYRASNDITSDFSPLGSRINRIQQPTLAAWRMNLANRMYNLQHPDKTTRFVPRKIMTTLPTPQTSTKDEVTMSKKNYTKITRLNQRIWTHYRKTSGHATDILAEKHHINPKILASTGEQGSLFAWADDHGVTMQELADAGLVQHVGGSIWKETNPASIITPIRDSKNRIIAFQATPQNKPLNFTSPSHTTQTYQPQQGLWGINAATKETLTLTHNAYLAGSILDAAQYQHQSSPDKKANIFAPTQGSITREHLDHIRHLAGGHNVTFTLIATGDKENDKKVLSEAFSQMSEQERGTTQVIMRHKPTETTPHNQAEQLTPLWQALADLTLPQHLTRSSAVEEHLNIATLIIDQLPRSMRQDSDYYVRHTITMQLKAQEAAKQTAAMSADNTITTTPTMN
ncbi:MobF family relaxase [Alloscardovia criceti]|uniref:MobF family relaxase n=1 Tax=Alloscardovia criceti TaxID=356828 RepID=UPI0003A2444F|nr:MobF family relaxase [Alloscardovia criceti]